MPSDDVCAICGNDGCQHFDYGNAYVATCQLCGRYACKEWNNLRYLLRERVPCFALSCAVRQASEADVVHLLDRDMVQSLIREHSNTTVTENLTRLLQYIGRKIKRPTDILKFDLANDFTLIDVESPEDFSVYLDWLHTDKPINLPYKGNHVPTVALSQAGWKRLEPLHSVGGEPGACFVAMWFAPEMAEAYELGILPAIDRGCGMKPVRIDRVEHNNQITDEIMAGIRGAQFMVADFTGHRAGVYYEAGFARGLGRDVIYCCRLDAFNERHFDTSVINHIVWTDPADLRTKLANRIKATILPKA